MNLSVSNGILHHAVHVLVVFSALVMWCRSAFPSCACRYRQMIYLFLMSIVPTIPAAWLSPSAAP